MAVDVKQYIDQLAQTAGLSQEEKDAILKVAGNEKFSKALGDDILRQQDYSRQSDALRADRQKWEKFYNDNLIWKAQEEDRISRILAAQNGNGDNGNGERPVIHGVQQDDLLKFRKELEEAQAKRDAQFVGLLKDVGRIASAHAVEFKETLDTDALEKVAMEKGLTLKAAYDEYVRPRREEAQAARVKADTAKAVEEAVRDYAAKHHIPVDTARQEYHPIFDRDTTKQVEYTPNTGRLTPNGERALRQNFVDSWNEAGAKTSGT